jgi:hypothetical protein
MGGAGSEQQPQMILTGMLPDIGFWPALLLEVHGRDLHFFVNGVISGASWERCISCRGLGILFTKPAAEIARLRRRVLDAFPGAAADPIPEFATALLVYDLAQGIIVDVSTQNAKGGARTDEKHQ